MESLLKDNEIITKSAVAKIKETKLKIQEKQEPGETFSSSLNELNENRLPGTSNTSAFLITNSKSVVNNTVTISYAGDNVCNKTLPIEEAPKSSSDHLHSVSNDVDLLLHFANKRDNVLPAIKDNLFSLKNSKPDDFQLQAEAYNDQVKASISKSAGAKEIYFRFRVQESLHKVIRYKTVVFQCHICKRIYKQKYSLKRHFLRNHINPKYISNADLSNCKIPIRNQEIIKKFVEESKKSSIRKKFNLKQAIFFVPDGKTRIPGLYKCHQCPGILFDIEQELEEHYSSHLILHSDDIFPCNLSSSVFQRKQALSKHMVLHSKPKKFGQKELTKEKPQEYSEGTQNLKNKQSNEKSLDEKKEASKADDHARKTGILGKKRTTYERKAKSSPQCKLSKDKSYRKKEEAEFFFYCNVSSNIADNLLNHVDGGPSQINLKKSNFEDQNESLDYRSSTNEIPWSAHSFPNYFDLDNAVSKRAEKSQLFPEEQCLYATGLERNEVLVENILNLSSDNSSGAEVQHNNQDSLLILEEKETLINHEICATYVCDVCKGTFSSYSAFEEHCFNNHPNVQVSYVEIEGTSKSPPKIPGELRRLPYTQPNGMLASREVPMLTQEKFDIKCTKCETKFNNKNDLYTHIFRCVAETQDICFRKKPHHKNRKGLAMKNQTDLAIKRIKSSGCFNQNNCFNSGRFRRNKFQWGKYYSNPQSNKRGRRKLPLRSKLRPSPCTHCGSVFISRAKLPEHVEICTYRIKSEGYKLKKKNQLKKQRNDRSPELSPSPNPTSEKGGICDAVKNSDISDKDISFLNCSYASAGSEMTFSAADLSKTPFKSNLKVSDARGNGSVLSRRKNFAVDRNILKTSQPSDFDMLLKLVKEVSPMLPKNLQIDDVSKSCFKRKEVTSNNSLDKSIVKSSVENCLADNLEKNKNIAQQFIAETKEISHGLVSSNLPKVKETQLAASSLPSLKKCNNQLMTFISPEVYQNDEHSSPNNNSSIQTALNFQSEKEYGAVSYSQQFEKAGRRKKRKPVKIMQKMTNETENSQKVGMHKELVSSSDKNNSVNDNIYALIPHSQNKYPTTSTTVNIEVFSPESQQSLCSDETGRKLHKKNSELSGKSASRQKDKKGDYAYKEDSDEKVKDDSIKPVQEEFAISNEVDAMTLVSGQKFNQLKDRVQSKLIEVLGFTPNETARTELQKKTSSKASLNKKCDSKNNNNLSPKLLHENHQPKFIFETNNQLFNENENKIQTGISTSGNCAKLRFLRMKRPAPDEFSDQTANGSTKLIRNLSATDISHNQISGKKKMLNKFESVAVMNISEAEVVAVDNLGGVGTQASIEIAKDFNCKDNCSKSLEEFPIAGSDRDVVVKKEKLDSEIVTHPSCPYCYLDFEYLSNFRRHLIICPNRSENTASEGSIASTSSQFQHFPKKNEVEESMLNLLRHQSRQKDLIKDAQKYEDSKTKNSFQTFCCQVCHKIYFNHVSFIQHTVNAHKMTNQETKTADPYAPSTSQDVTVMSLEETKSESNMSLHEISDTDISSVLSTNIKILTTSAQNRVKKSSQIETIGKEGNTSICINHDELKSDNKGIESGPTQKAAMFVENLNSKDGSTSVTKTKTIALSSDERKVSESQTARELSDTSLSILPAFEKGRGRKKKSILENGAENRRELKSEVQSAKTEDISSVNDSRDDTTSSKKEPVTNNPLLKEVSKALLSDLQSSPKNTLVNKLRSTLTKSMQSGDKLKSSSSKFGKQSEIVKSNVTSDVKHLENDSFSFKSLIKRNSIETLKITGKTDVLNGSQPLHIPRRGRKKSVVAQAPIEALDSSIEAKNIEPNSRLQNSSKSNKLKALRKQSLPGPGFPTISDEKGISIKKSIANTFQSSKFAKAVKSTKISLQEVDADTFSSHKSSTVSRKAKGPRGIEANCDNEPTPSTFYGPSRGRKSKLINISLDLSSELEDVEDIQQRNPKLKKKPINKVCPICKQKFPTLLQRNRHLQLVHGRKRSRNDGSISATLVSVKKETVNKLIDISVKKEIVNKISDSSLKTETVTKVSNSLSIVPHRSAYQRQCSKPLPPMKRKYQKVDVKNIQPIKKPKF